MSGRSGRRWPGMRRGARSGFRLVAVVGVLMLLGAAFAPRLLVHAQEDQSSGDWFAPRTVYIPETGHTIDGVFLDYWRAWGGAGAFGNPITAEFEENGRTVQYYAYARFEYWPDDPDGNVVRLGTIGKELQPPMFRQALPGFGRVARLGGESAREAMSAARAWMPITEKQLPKFDDVRYVAETKHSIYGGFRTYWENTGEASYLGNPISEEYVLDGRSFQVFERGQLTWIEGEDIRLVPVGQTLVEQYGLDTSPVDQGDVPTYGEELFQPPPTPTPVPTEAPTPTPAASAAAGAYGEEEQGAYASSDPAPPVYAPKSIVVSIGAQTLWAYEGDTIVNSTLVSTGRPGFDTPLGTFTVDTKIDVQDMEGVLGGEYYNVPQVPWVMYFTAGGHAIHGTYWHGNFGSVMSHGCVNLPMGMAEWLYGWAEIGTPIVIVG